jgi:lipoprotein signal peptidase
VWVFWNFADFSISTGIILLFIRQKTYFPKEGKNSKIENQTDNVELNKDEV